MLTSPGHQIAMIPKLFIDQGRTTLYRLFWYIGQYRLNTVFTWVDCYNTHYTAHVTDF